MMRVTPKFKQHLGLGIIPILETILRDRIFQDITPPTGSCWSYNTKPGWWFQPLWKILVSWDDYYQYMEK